MCTQTPSSSSQNEHRPYQNQNPPRNCFCSSYYLLLNDIMTCQYQMSPYIGIKCNRFKCLYDDVNVKDSFNYQQEFKFPPKKCISYSLDNVLLTHYYMDQLFCLCVYIKNRIHCAKCKHQSIFIRHF